MIIEDPNVIICRNISSIIRKALNLFVKISLCIINNTFPWSFIKIKVLQRIEKIYVLHEHKHIQNTSYVPTSKNLKLYIKSNKQNINLNINYNTIMTKI